MNFRVTDTNFRHHQDAANPRFYRGRSKKTIAFVWPEGETIMQNLMNRRSRPIKQFRQSVEQAFDAIGVNRNNITIKWSQKAGCQCGCSPGFIIDGWDAVLYKKDVHITIKGD